MIKVPYIDKEGGFEINPKEDLLEFNEKLVAQVSYILDWRQKEKPGNAKGRSDVRGGGKKPWKQKGTGRARAGTIRSPLFVGGGVTHGPSGVKGLKRIPKKMRVKALGQLYVQKALSKEIFVVDKLEVKGGKTKEADGLFKNRLKPIVLIVGKEESKSVLPYRNISYITPSYFGNVSFAEILSKKELVFTSKSIVALKSLLEKKNEVN
jgi:large subunit ribosomal protein L4